LAFLMPFSLAYNYISQSMVVLFYFPLIIALGAGATLTAGLKRLCNFLGNVSYPLYMTHYFALWLFAGYLTTYKPTTNQLFFIIPISVLLLLSFAYLVMVIYDIPVRRYLSIKRKKSFQKLENGAQ